MNLSDQNTAGESPALTTTTTIQHDWDDDSSLAVSIVTGIARLAETDPEDVPQLYERFDPDSLESLFEPTRRAGARNDGHVWIPIDDYGVTVYGNGTVIVRRFG